MVFFSLQPIDPDTVGGPLTFDIIGDASSLWHITTGYYSDGRQYGNITALRNIRFDDARYPAPGEYVELVN